MKDTVTTPESVDPYVTLENILKIIGRSWLSEEWRLEDIRLLAKEATEQRRLAPQGSANSAILAPRPQKTATRVNPS